MKLGHCPKCAGNLLLEADVPEGLLLRKCLQCGLIESYFWLERSTRRLVPLPVETDPPESVDDWKPAHRAVLSCTDTTKKNPPLEYQDLELGGTEQRRG